MIRRRHRRNRRRSGREPLDFVRTLPHNCSMSEVKISARIEERLRADMETYRKLEGMSVEGLIAKALREFLYTCGQLETARKKNQRAKG